jgi:hypothetical protein
MLSRRGLFVGLACSALTAGCENARPTNGVLDASESVDPAFTACGASCGLHSARERKLARKQPGVGTGEVAFCPVSGAVFRVKENSPSRSARGHLLYFCCEACAAFFTAHEADVLARRGIT